MRELLHLDLLRRGRSLLAYSGGVDSSALFHLLLEHGIDFDIAHVNYHTRAQSDAEEKSALALARRHHKQCHTQSSPLQGSDFEHRAREERYRFFGYLMAKHGYDYLLTAHQLNDRLEWMMMQLCRGAGLPELLGIRSRDRRGEITILRPLLEWDRESIETYLHEHRIPCHTDESNADERYARNRFRLRYAAPMMREYASAIRRSFRYLEEDADALIEPVTFERAEEFHYAPSPVHIRSAVVGIDRLLKSLGYVLKGDEKEKLKTEGSVVAGRKYIITVDATHLFVAPYRHGVSMEKPFREECRRLGIDPKLRGYLYANPAAMEVIRRLKGGLKPLRSG